jgi:uncharacterized membrane protein YeaQ/YmgE (transglycosylase-associated protein family)
MNILSWIIFGAIAGWVASLISGTNRRQGLLMDIVVGIVGAGIGGLVWGLLSGNPFTFGFNLSSFAVAVLGSVILLAIAKAVGRRR